MPPIGELLGLCAKNKYMRENGFLAHVLIPTAVTRRKNAMSRDVVYLILHLTAAFTGKQIETFR